VRGDQAALVSSAAGTAAGVVGAVLPISGSGGVGSVGLVGLGRAKRLGLGTSFFRWRGLSGTAGARTVSNFRAARFSS